MPSGIYPYPVVEREHRRRSEGRLGWKSLELLELTALPSIQRDSWVPTLQETDALLIWGGKVLYLSYWMRQSGLADLLPSLENLVYVGVSAGRIVTTPYNCDIESNLQFVPPGSDMALGGETALGLVDFALYVHLENPDPIFRDHSLGFPACQPRPTRLTTKPPSKSPEVPSKSSPRGTGSCSRRQEQATKRIRLSPCAGPRTGRAALRSYGRESKKCQSSGFASALATSSLVASRIFGNPMVNSGSVGKARPTSSPGPTSTVIVRDRMWCFRAQRTCTLWRPGLTGNTLVWRDQTSPAGFPSISTARGFHSPHNREGPGAHGPCTRITP